MDAIVISWRELLVAVILASLIYLLEAAVFTRRRRMQSDTAAQTPAAGPDAQAVAELRAEVAQLSRRLEQLEARLQQNAPQREDDTPYGRAVRLAREGLSAQELASRCGISRGEAELIIALNRVGS
ncbi:MAG: DUF2802 domain-containing protein [Thiobacillaceae bacterium]|nr:DUF2802 domain-containing protein [Thiobacillaceae bacterium]MDW8324175.1 DUF2802 domain-containing protein [Burkholderiales bacterium]